MSPRAACRLEQLGFDAYDYALGKNDWLAWGLEYEGTAELVGSQLTDVATVRIDARVREVHQVLEGAPFDFAVVVADGGLVLGRVSVALLEDVAADAAVADVMQEGPTTVRAATERTQMLHRMEHAGVGEVLVTRPDGVLLGVFQASQTAQG